MSYFIAVFCSMNTCSLTLPSAPVALVEHVVGPEHLAGAGGGVAHGATDPGAQAVASLGPSRAGGACLQ